MTGKHLAEHCRAEYPKVTNFVLWILAELAVVACDIPEGIELTFLQLLLHIFYFALQSYVDCTVQPFGNACGFCNSISVPDIKWKLQFWQITQMVALVNLSW